MDQNPIEAPQHAEPLLPPALPSASSLLDQSYRHYRARVRDFLPIGLVMLVISLAQLGAIYTRSLALSVTVLLIGTVVSLFTYLAMMKVAANEPDQPLRDTTRWTVRSIGSYLLIVGITIAAVMGGFVLLLIPGLVISFLSMFALYSFVVEKRKGMEAINASWHYVKARWWEIIMRLFVFFLVMIAISIAVSLVSFLLNSAIYGYRDAMQLMDLGIQSPYDFVINQLVSALFIVPLIASFFYLLFKAVVANVGPIGDEEKVRSTLWLNIFMCLGIAVLILLIGAGIYFGAFVAPEYSDLFQSFPVRSI